MRDEVRETSGLQISERAGHCGTFDSPWDMRGVLGCVGSSARAGLNVRLSIRAPTQLGGLQHQRCLGADETFPKDGRAAPGLA